MEQSESSTSAPPQAPDDAGRVTDDAAAASFKKLKEACDKQFAPETPMTYPLPKAGDGDHWKACHGILEKHDNYLCQGWNNDIDTLLVFAGLFSAAVTAFTIESYKWLQPDSGDTTVLLLQQISRQLADSNTTLASSAEDFHISSSGRRINIFWFLSLVVALMTALLGILCKQWLREYQKDAALSYKDSVALRQMRFEAFVYWRVENFISALPLLLQLALLLFILGVLDLLWTLDRVTAGVITAAAVLGFGFVVATTALPGVVLWHSRGKLAPEPPFCAFKSPQAWLFARALLFISSSKTQIDSWLGAEKTVLKNYPKRYLYRSVFWLDENLAQNDTTFIHLANCLQDIQHDCEEFDRALLGVLSPSGIAHCYNRAFQKGGSDPLLFHFLSGRNRNFDDMNADFWKHYAELMLRMGNTWHTHLDNSYMTFQTFGGYNLSLALVHLQHDFEAGLLSDTFIYATRLLMLRLLGFEYRTFFYCLILSGVGSTFVDFVCQPALDTITLADEAKKNYMRTVVLDASFGWQMRMILEWIKPEMERPFIPDWDLDPDVERISASLLTFVARIRPEHGVQWDDLQKELEDVRVDLAVLQSNRPIAENHITQ